MELYIQNRWNNKDDAPRLKKNIVLEHYLLKKNVSFDIRHEKS